MNKWRHEYKAQHQKLLLSIGVFEVIFFPLFKRVQSEMNTAGVNERPRLWADLTDAEL